MNNELIFKKVDSKLFFHNKVVSDIIKSPQEEPHTELEEKVEEELIQDKDVDASLENASLDEYIYESSGSIPAIPNKLVSSTKSVLKIIGWINDKINKPTSSLPNISQESGIENRDEYLDGMSNRRDST